MRRTSLLATLLFSGAALLITGETAEAQFRRGYVGMPAYHMSTYHPTTYHPAPLYRPNHMPGWDWWRIYPWSPYNYGRNPYNPIILPYPAYPYPVIPPYPPPLYPSVTTAGTAPLVLPPPTVQPTAGQSAPPPDAALVVVRIPDAFAQVLFNGERTFTQGRSLREFVTPELAAGKSYTYTITATWTRDGQPVTEQRAVTVTRGQTSTVDFTRPAAK